VKLRLGRRSFADDIVVVRAARKGLPSTVHLMVDFNQG
jgi:L-alanine-DL-glutamate epimerase-like enolase superfamily enzyme